MAHLEDRLAEFIFEELSPADMESARRHVAQCLECQGRVAAFRKIRHSLEALPEADMPRRLVFVPSDPPAPSRRRWLPLRWATPLAAAAALLLAFLIVPVQIDWNGSGVQIAVGRAPTPAVASEPTQAPAIPPIQPIDYDTLDYDRIAARLQDEQKAWVQAEVDGRIRSSADANSREIQRVRAEIDYLAELQQLYEREMLLNTYSIEQLALRTGGTE